MEKEGTEVEVASLFVVYVLGSDGFVLKIYVILLPFECYMLM